MWKKAVLRGLLGIPMGVFIGYTVTILISLTVGDGVYTPAVPALIEEYGEMGAVGLQYLLAALLGGACAAGSVIWQIEDWSILKQTTVHFFVLSLSMLPIAYTARWMEHTGAGALLYFGIFAGLYLLIWLIQYLFWRYRIGRINRIVRKKP